MMIRAANSLAEARRVSDLAGDATIIPDWGPVAERIRDQATDNWDDTVAVDRFEGKGGHFVHRYARITAPGTVEVNDDTYVASRGIVIATGTLAAVPAIPGLADTPYWTNHDVMQAKDLPRSLIVLGGGAIGTELAQVFTAEGIAVHTGQFVDRVEFADEQFVLTMPDGTTLAAEKLLVAAGRKTFLRELGAEHLGIDPDAPFLAVDGHQRVADGVWGVGDIAGEGLFTHLAVRQADVAVADILGRSAEPLNLDALSSVTFTDPEIGVVGRTEAGARERGINVATATKPVPHTARGWLHGIGNEGLIKLVVDTDRDVLVVAKRVLAITAGLEEKILVLLRSEEPGYRVVPRAIYFRYLKRIAANLLGVVSTATEPLPNIDYLDDGATDVTDD
jgi:pyruvate/2-oxoglutarate dehydrogenase complex dihydrolipoamide dehydrogenase (E3) component